MLVVKPPINIMVNKTKYAKPIMPKFPEATNIPESSDAMSKTKSETTRPMKTPNIFILPFNLLTKFLSVFLKVITAVFTEFCVFFISSTAFRTKSQLNAPNSIIIISLYQSQLRYTLTVMITTKSKDLI